VGGEQHGEGIALVTVIHDSAAELEQLLASVSRHLPQATVVVADSGSSDDGLARAAGWRGRSVTLDLEANVGFGRATNAGVAAHGEPVTVVVNPDVELLDASLVELARELSAGPERILAPLVLLPDGSRQDSVQHEPGTLPPALAALVPPLALPPGLRQAVDPWRSDRPRRVGWAVGCCLAARTETLRRLGPFDERIFMYAEDLELGLRASDEGLETWFWPRARVLHHGTHSTAIAFDGEPFELLARQRREVVRRRRGPQRARLDDWQQLATFCDRIALKAIAGRPHGRERRQLAALRRARRAG
jgi:N-acetylglucosaminyl-diphospho-decaprenol L-rhamnosyltransferase